MQLQLNRMEAKLDELLVLKGIVGELTEAKRLERHKERARKAEVRQAARAERDATSLPLADNIFKGDSRLVPHFKKWALKGMEFGRNNQPEKLANYVCWQWNCATFLRKPITFSGGYFQYWIGSKSGRMHTTPFELMHLSKKSKMILRNDGEHADFRERKWWATTSGCTCSRRCSVCRGIATCPSASCAAASCWRAGTVCTRCTPTCTSTPARICRS